MPAHKPASASDCHTRKIVISISERRLALLEDGRLVKSYPIAVGARVSPSPDGEFAVINHAKDPTYRHGGKEILPGKDNPLGTRWIGLSLKGYGIHGTNVPRSIGKAASHGCFRMAQRDVEDLYSRVQVGDTVIVRRERDELIARIFAAPAAARSRRGSCLQREFDDRGGRVTTRFIAPRLDAIEETEKEIAMLLLKYLLLFTGWGLLITAVAHALRNVYQVVQYHRQLRLVPSATEPPSTHGATVEKPQLNWTTAKWAFLAAWLPLIVAAGIVVVPSGMGGVRASQTAGTLPGTLYPGVHLVRPLIDSVVLYDIRDQVLTTSSSGKDGLGPAAEQAAERKQKENGKPDAFTVQSREGLSIGLAITVRYRLDPRRLDYIHANLPQPVEKEIVPPVISSVFRELAPNYTVREVFATRREEIRQNAAARITSKLGSDGIIVKEVMLRDVQLPAEYAKGLEGLLLKEQENEGLGVETEMKAKQVRIAELEAEAQRVQQVKQAQGARPGARAPGQV